MGHFGIGELTAVTILAELGDARRFSSSREAVRYAGHGHHRAPVRPAPRARASEPPGTAGAALGAVRGRAVRRARRQPRPRLLPPGGGAPRRATARACRSRASCSSAATTRCASSARRRCNPHEAGRCARSPQSHRCAAAGSLPAPAATPAWTALIDRAAATLPPAGSPHQPSCRRPRRTAGTADRDKAGRPRAHDPHHQPRPRAPVVPSRQPDNARTGA